MYNPEVDFNGNFSENMIFVNHRTPFYKSWFKILLSFAAKLNDNFRTYISGQAPAYWSSVIPYSKGTRVVFVRGVYESLINSNNAAQPDINPAKWEKVLDNFVGVEERSCYTGQKIVLEYALNNYFKYELLKHSFGGYLQPDSPTTPTPSSIYLTPVVPAFYSFAVFGTEQFTDSVFLDSSTGIVYDTEVLVTSSSYEFNINIPSSVYTEIGVPSITDKIIDNLVKKYLSSGITYNIVTY